MRKGGAKRKKKGVDDVADALLVALRAAGILSVQASAPKRSDLPHGDSGQAPGAWFDLFDMKAGKKKAMTLERSRVYIRLDFFPPDHSDIRIFPKDPKAELSGKVNELRVLNLDEITKVEQVDVSEEYQECTRISCISAQMAGSFRGKICKGKLAKKAGNAGSDSIDTIIIKAVDSKCGKRFADFLESLAISFRKSIGLDADKDRFPVIVHSPCDALFYSHIGISANSAEWAAMFCVLTNCGIAFYDERLSDKKMREKGPRATLTFTEASEVETDGANILAIKQVRLKGKIGGEGDSTTTLRLLFVHKLVLDEWEAFAHQAVFLKSRAVTMNAYDVQLFKKGEWLNDKCFDFWFTYMEVLKYGTWGSPAEYGGHSTCLLVRPMVLSCLLLNTDSKKEIDALRKSMPTLESTRIFVLPITDRTSIDSDSSHWSLLVLRMESQKEEAKLEEEEDSLSCFKELATSPKKGPTSAELMSFGKFEHWDSKTGYNTAHSHTLSYTLVHSPLHSRLHSLLLSLNHSLVGIIRPRPSRPRTPGGS
jgi:hypothetical protein